MRILVSVGGTDYGAPDTDICLSCPNLDPLVILKIPQNELGVDSPYVSDYIP